MVIGLPKKLECYKRLGRPVVPGYIAPKRAATEWIPSACVSRPQTGRTSATLAGRRDVTLLIILLILILLFGGGGYYYGGPDYPYRRGGLSIGGILLVVLIVLFITHIVAF
jgi:hypothetical protein